ncbi:hypothetical protein TNCV_1501111 [Trichonephila clavipes]|uniref:Uncharacterized protein n=1 Tax=Trichonephila clavipes TaxID=2585209 RepID=A0A8X6V430_TRICX|nr:hypothetical protein TNCV_1501111 [Trichonephila clavipes]
MSSRWCGVVVKRGGASSSVVHVTSSWFKITWSVAKSPRVAEQCDVNIQSIFRGIMELSSLAPKKPQAKRLKHVISVQFSTLT